MTTDDRSLRCKLTREGDEYLVVGRVHSGVILPIGLDLDGILAEVDLYIRRVVDLKVLLVARSTFDVDGEEQFLLCGLLCLGASLSGKTLEILETAWPEVVVDGLSLRRLVRGGRALDDTDDLTILI